MLNAEGDISEQDKKEKNVKGAVTPEEVEGIVAAEMRKPMCELSKGSSCTFQPRTPPRSERSSSKRAMGLNTAVYDATEPITLDLVHQDTLGNTLVDYITKNLETRNVTMSLSSKLLMQD